MSDGFIMIIIGIVFAGFVGLGTGGFVYKIIDVDMRVRLAEMTARADALEKTCTKREQYDAEVRVK